ncbi:MAG: glutamate--tRNA ligase [Elusimicrobiota bacterium]|jgi:glutamyl-tRNA synthetase|nr:glutamate--tRNA ligase [Elusimicrobiota bacterium]
MKIRVRFAPSPTGHLHIGGLRTALFNYLFAKKEKGAFILRIEDTDEERSTQESVNAIYDGMIWAGLNWDEGPMPDGSIKGDYAPYYQAARSDAGIYQKYIDQLLAEGKAYKCYCTPKELEDMRAQAIAEKRPPRYDGRCSRLTLEQQKELEAQGRRPVIRFKMPKEGETVFNDLIRGEVRFANKDLYDLVIQKTGGYPTYNFAAVIDDHLMEMSHIIRGDDHISNTPMQIRIYEALGWKHPIMAHLSMIHGPDGTKLSKRHGDTSVIEYKKQGYLPQALINYLALLGWSTPDSQQIFAPGELEEKFDIRGCQKSPAVFDPVKLLWMNGDYMRRMTIDELYAAAKPFIDETGVAQGVDEEYLKKIILLEQEKYKTLKEIPELISFFFTDKVVFDEAAIEKVFKAETASLALKSVIAKYEALADFTEFPIEAATKEAAKENGLKNGQVFHPVRVAVSGRTNGPTLFKMLEYMGKDMVLKRLEAALELCSK